MASGHSVVRAARVAALATILIGVVYATVVAVFDEMDANHLVAEVDAHLSDRLAEMSSNPSLASGTLSAYRVNDVEDAPILLWNLQPDGQTDAQTPGSPALPRTISTRSPDPFDVRIGSTTFRMKVTEVHGSHLVAAQSLANTTHVEQVLLAAELIAGPVLLIGTYLGTLVIGIMASGPVEQSRRRQLEFTQDASHELRTPLSVIQAEVGLALNSDRSQQQYREALVKVGHEGGRLRHIVDDLLWLARFDSYRPTSDSEPLDICAIAESCRERFGSIAQARGIEIVVDHHGQSPALIDAPPDLIDRLAGVLVDNACSYAREGGEVHIATYASAHSVSLAVDDNGPGIPEEHRNRLFDRFHRATEDGSGTGLGLAIADSVVRSTTGRWKVSDSLLGGAHMEVSWRPSSLSAAGGRRITELWTWRPRVGSHPVSSDCRSTAGSEAQTSRSQ